MSGENCLSGMKVLDLTQFEAGLHAPKPSRGWARTSSRSRYATPDARTERREEVDALVTDWTRRHDKHEAMRLVNLATVPAAAVLDTAELAADQTFQDRGIRQTMKHPTAGDYVMSGWPVRFDRETPPVAPAPLLGQHGPEVLAEWLKMDAEQIGALRKDSVVT